MAESSSSSSSGQEEQTPPELVILDWKDIVAKETSDHVLSALERALGPGGFGLVAIRHVPGFVQAKNSFLPLTHSLVQLSSDYLETHLTDAASLYNAGWSHGKEKLGDKPDFAKGSYYFNPITDEPGTEHDRATYPLSYPKNIWPNEEETSLPQFKKKAICIGRILKEAAAELAKHIDALALLKVPNYTPQFLYHAMKDTEKAKARLLYYFPLELAEDQVPSEDSWIGYVIWTNGISMTKPAGVL
jgi:hypothetical protein